MRPGLGWGAPNADLANTRRVGGPIDGGSVGRLRLAWSIPLTAAYAATPVILDGVAYTQDLESNVYAIDIRHGTLLWKRTFAEPDTGPNGVNVAGGRVYGATPTDVFALDPGDGAVLWRTKLSRRPAETIDMAPGYHDGTVYVSTVPNGTGVASALWAIDGATGNVRWRWSEVPAGLWGDPDVNAGGGAWHPPAFDERGGLYIGIANPVPWPGTEAAPLGASRPGANRWDNSIVKLDAQTGAFVWGRQAVAHDIYDWDLECPVILARTAGDQGHQVALVAGKMGIVYAFDAQTGTLLWKRSVGLHNGHDHDALQAMRGDYSFFRPGQRVLPGDWGGVETPMASDGETVYVPVNNLFAIYRDGFSLPEQQSLLEGTGEIVALDIVTGRVTWDRRLAHGVYGAATIANDVIFTTTVEGTLWALDTRTGRIIWQAHLPAGTDAPVAVSGAKLVTAASIPLSEDQHAAILGYRLKGGAGS